MIKFYETADDKSDIDSLIPQDPDSPEAVDVMAQQVEDIMQQQALESAYYFEGAEEAIDEFVNSPEYQVVLNESIIAGVAKNNTIIKLNQRDDMKRRARLASIILAKNANDPLFKKLALNRVKERALRKAIFLKYGKRAYKVALVSKKKHALEIKSHPSMPTFHRDMTGAKTNYASVFANNKVR